MKTETTAIAAHFNPAVMGLDTEVINTKKDDLKKVDPRNIEIEEGFNERIDYGDIDALARSVVELGVLEPVKAYKKKGEDKYVLTDGHRRMKAVNLAIKYHNANKEGFEDISKIQLIKLLAGPSTRKERLLEMAVTGEGKKPLTDLEKASLYQKLIDISMAEGKKRGEAITELRAKLGVSQATVYNILQLNALPEEIKTAIEKKEISGSTVTTIIREAKSPEEQVRMVNEAIEDAKQTAQASGKATVKKATAKNVKGIKPKTPIQKIKAVAEKLENAGVKNTRANALITMMSMLEEGASINKIYELFV